MNWAEGIRFCDLSGWQDAEHLAGLAEVGVDELVLVEGPPEDPAAAPDWVAGLAERWLPAPR